ncbi:GNAT family N-acetyltransferase [Kiloniella laminariae]|uniref:GNAT family N-acetyltransferase n=1 Tax=Kiloniella laminariae TaxID=454162 RepID=A0ABT4LNT2_9PROT|nr:GNAT family N-acetyltransferase [Kiloniella laminariae]MCZ4282805.1 GNAT family N-acetyltransferase [Kiloniella laminariae]
MRRIRKVREQDAEGIVALLNPIITHGSLTAMNEILSVAEQISYQRSFPDEGIFLVAVAEEEQQVLGFQSIEPLAKGQHPTRHKHMICANQDAVPKPESRDLVSPGFSGEGEISTFVSLSHQGDGIGRNLCAASFEAARAQGYQKISAYIRADNPVALSFYQKNGFRLVERLKNTIHLKDGFVDQIWTVKEL